MPKFYKYTLEDVVELFNNCNDLDYLNKFNNTHLYYTCSCCGKEELYVKSPVVNDELWETTVKKLGLRENKKPCVCYSYSLSRLTSEQVKAVRFYNQFKNLIKVEDDSTYTMLCRSCVEKAIERKLHKEDLKPCIMTDMVIDEYESKND